MRFSISAFIFTLTSALRYEIEAATGKGAMRCQDQFISNGQEIRGNIDVPSKSNIQVDFLV
jgi:hypothetical protein